jgi:hypothetical protein
MQVGSCDWLQEDTQALLLLLSIAAAGLNSALYLLSSQRCKIAATCCVLLHATAARSFVVSNATPAAAIAAASQLRPV